MKPLPVAPLTVDDELIWFIAAVRIDPQRRGMCRTWAANADRRDAELMLHCQRNRYDPDMDLPGVPSCVWLGPLWCQVGPAGGVLSARYNITYCA